MENPTLADALVSQEDDVALYAVIDGDSCSIEEQTDLLEDVRSTVEDSGCTVRSIGVKREE